MKKSLLFIAAVCLFSACNALDGLLNENISNSPIKVAPTLTKVAETTFDLNDAIGLTVIRNNSVWAENERLVYDGNSFSGDLNWYHGEDVCKLKAYYPYSETTPTSFTVALDQSNGNSSSDFVAAIKEGVTPTANAVPMTFTHKLSRVVFNINNQSHGSVAAIYLSGTIPTATIGEDFEIGVANASAEDIKAYKASETQYRLITVPQTGAFTVKVSLAGVEMTQKLASVELKSGKEYSVTVVVQDTDILVVINGEIDNWNDGGELVGADTTGPEYVDLGLPSGLLWATTNVGAENPWDIGGRYAWGEIATKDWYDWDNYKWCNGSEMAMTKYCSDSAFGFVDNKTILDESDDVAHVVYGGLWRMPTKEEAEELYSNCIWTSETLNGVNGYRATAANGNSLFFPLNGQYDEGGINCSDYEFQIWTTRCNEDYWAYRLCNYGVTLSNHKHDGLCIRAVKSSTGGHDVSSVKNLSENGTANCYMVKSAGQYSFDASVKGNSNISVGTPVKAAVVWETFNNEEKPSVGDIVKDVTLTSNQVSFNATGRHGNALIAVLDDSDEILWSWHIWATDYVPAAEFDTYVGHESTPMMNRNLGALSKTSGDIHSYGLLYQWGRKDPFMGAKYTTSGEPASSTIDFPTPVQCSEETGTVAYSISHPTTFIYLDYDSNWLYADDMTLWASTKTEYDPCPAGWRVPDGGENGIWSNFTSYAISNQHGFSYGTDLTSPETWYPATGAITSGSGMIDGVGEHGWYWSVTCEGSYNVDIDMWYDRWSDNSSPIYNNTYAYDLDYGKPIRCCKENL